MRFGATRYDAGALDVSRLARYLMLLSGYDETSLEGVHALFTGNVFLETLVKGGPLSCLRPYSASLFCNFSCTRMGGLQVFFLFEKFP